MARVVIGLSGGVDSSVAAYLLKQQGHDVVGLFMINWHDTTGTLEGDCPWHDDRVFAELVAKNWTSRCTSSTSRRTTAPAWSITCSRNTKRDARPTPTCCATAKSNSTSSCAKRSGWAPISSPRDTTAARPRRRCPTGEQSINSSLAPDPNKDQSYFLCQLSQEQLRYALFPVGDLLKPEVRRIAAEQGLATAKRKDSQGICFVGKVDLPAFLQQKLASKRGNVHEILPTWPKYGPKARIPAGTPDAGQAIPAPASPAAERPEGDLHSPGGQHAADVPPTTEQLAALAAPWRYTVRDGKKIGEHGGAHFYTIASARGSASAGARNRCSSSPPTPCRTSSMSARATATPACGDRHCISPPARYTGSTPRARCPAGQKRPLQRPHPLPPAFAGGHALRPRPGSLHPLRHPQRGITPGQFAAWYDGDELVGSGVISE